MSRRWLELALSIVAFAFLTFSFARMYKTAGSENAKFESKVAAGRAFMYVSRALLQPLECDKKLIPLIKEWTPKKGPMELELEGTKMTLRERGQPFSPRFAKVELSLPSEHGEHLVLLDLALNPENSKPVQCRMDVEALRFRLAGSILSISKCVQPQQTPYWYVRCAKGFYLNKESNPGNVMCCPLEG